MLQQVTIVGNLVADPEYRRTQTGKIQMRLRVACNWTDFRGNRHSVFYGVSLFPTEEQYSRDYAAWQNSKGKLVAVTGNLEIKANENGRGYSFIDISRAIVRRLWKNDVQPGVQASQQTVPQQTVPQQVTPQAASSQAPDQAPPVGPPQSASAAPPITPSSNDTYDAPPLY